MLAPILIYVFSVLIWIYILEYHIKCDVYRETYIVFFISYISVFTLILIGILIPPKVEPKFSDHEIVVESNE